MDLTKYPLTEFEQRLVGVATSRGYELTHVLVKVFELSHSESHQTIYLQRSRTNRNAIKSVIHPETHLELLKAIESIHGVTVSSSFLHHANLRRYPKELNDGVDEIAFGRRVDCADITAYDRMLQTLAAN